MSRYPAPAYALTVWFNGEGISVAREGQGPEGHGTSVVLPATEAGMKTLLGMMKERNAATESYELKLGHSGTPTQYELDKNRGAASFFRLVREEREVRKAKRDEDQAERIRRRELREKRVTKEKVEAQMALAALGLRKKA